MTGFEAITQAIGLGITTLASEDLALIGAAVLIQERKIGLWTGLAGVGGGILLGDIGLWLAGRVFVNRLLRTPLIARRVSTTRLEAARRALESRLPLAVLTSRFLPGSRLALHLAAGSLGRGGLRYALWTTIAVALWVPLVVGLVVLAGGRAAGVLQAWVGSAWLGTGIAALLGLLVLRAIGTLRAATTGGEE